MDSPVMNGTPTGLTVASQIPSTSERRYDRQLRLWASDGQVALERAHVLLLNSGCGVAGIEALKNLVLPGIGEFTIVDPFLVTEQDLGINFFLTEDDIGFSRAERCAALLRELNPNVNSNAIHKPFLEAFQQLHLDQFALIICALPVSQQVLEILQSNQNVPTIYMHSLSFYSHFTLQLPPAHPIVDIHPDPGTTHDLRLSNPWPELLDLMERKTANMEHMDDEEHGHIPYLLILLHYVQKFRAEHGGNTPQSYKDKIQLRELVKSGMRTNNAEGGEENWEEAMNAVMRSFNPSEASSALREVLQAPECDNILNPGSIHLAQSAQFWLVARAIKEFVGRYGVVPLPGSIPDMKAKSADYVELQNVYKQKAVADALDVAVNLASIQAAVDPSAPPIPKSYLDNFCKCANHVKLLRGHVPSVAVPTRGPDPASPLRMPEKSDALRRAADAASDETSLVALLYSFIAYDEHICSTESFHSSPSKVDPQFENLNSTIETIVLSAMELVRRVHSKIREDFPDGKMGESKMGVTEFEDSWQALEQQVHKICADLVNARGGELHNVASLTGGMVAQEAIKVITKQYVPIDNTCLYDGISSRTSVLRL